MSNVTIKVSAYTGAYSKLNADHAMNINKYDIARGIISIGKTHWSQQFRDPIRTINDFVHQWTGLNTYVQLRPKLCLDPSFLLLDGSDKNNKSYNIGMGVTRIVAERILNIPYLNHVDALVSEGIIKLTAGSKERGDLAGMDKYGKWHVLEAKGRSTSPTKAMRTKAKAQAERITTINGISPETKGYCLSYLSIKGSKIELVDPDDLPDAPTGLEVDPDRFIKSYYDHIFKPFYGLPPDASTVVNRTNYNLYDLPDTDLFIGIPKLYMNDLERESVAFTKIPFRSQSLDRLLSSFKRNDRELVSIGLDGVLLMHKSVQPMGRAHYVIFSANDPEKSKAKKDASSNRYEEMY